MYHASVAGLVGLAARERCGGDGDCLGLAKSLMRPLRTAGGRSSIAAASTASCKSNGFSTACTTIKMKDGHKIN